MFLNAERGRCDICSGVLPARLVHTPVHQPGARLCGSLVCAFKHQTLPAAHKCVVCDRPLTSIQWPQRCCAAPACAAEMRRRSPAAQASQMEVEAFNTSGQHRRRSAAARGIPQHVAETFPPTLIPANKARISKLPKSRRAAFEAHLRSCLHDAQQAMRDTAVDEPLRYEAEPLDNSHRTAAERSALSQLMIAGCIMCRGRCCLGGSDHAFHSAETLRKYLLRHPDRDTERIVAEFMNDMGEHTMTNGCVFQGEHGCTLDSERRSPTCHQYFCPGLRSAYDQHEPGEPVRAYFVQIRNGKITRSQFVEAQPPTV